LNGDFLIKIKVKRNCIYMYSLDMSALSSCVNSGGSRLGQLFPILGELEFKSQLESLLWRLTIICIVSI